MNNCKKENMDVIAVVLGAGTTEQRFSETKEILEYAIKNYEIINLNEYVKESITIPIDKCSEYNIIAKRIDNVSIPILKQDKEKLDIRYNIVDNIILPVDKNAVLGYAQILVQEKEIMKLEYVAQKEYKKNTYIYYMKFILGNYINLLKIE